MNMITEIFTKPLMQYNLIDCLILIGFVVLFYIFANFFIRVIRRK